MAGLVTSENQKWWTVAAVAFGLFMLMLDNTVVKATVIPGRLSAVLSNARRVAARGRA